MGIDFWALTDGGTAERTNWGLTSAKDNPYDGKATTIAAGTDQWGYATGGGTRNYGDFLDGVTQSNTIILQQLIQEQQPQHQ